MAAFVLLLVGEVIQLGLIPVAGAIYPGYDHLRQYVSELGATGAVTGPAVSWLGFLPGGLLIAAFCVLSGWIQRRQALAVTAMVLIFGYAFGLIGAAFYPCAYECGRATPSLNQAMHDLIGGLGYLTGVVGVFLAAVAARRGAAPWLFPLGMICGVVAALGFGGLLADIELIGLSQRILEAAMTLFLLAYGWSLAKGRLAPPLSSSPL